MMPLRDVQCAQARARCCASAFGFTVANELKRSALPASLMIFSCFHAYKRNYRLRRWFHINQKKRSERLSYGDLPCRTTCPDTDREVRVLSFGGVYLVYLHTFS